MAHDPVCCTRTTSVRNAAGMMRALDIGFLPVIDELWTRKLMGVVTDRDLCLTALGEPHDPTLTTVEDCMATEPVTCTPDMDIREVLETMAQHQVRRLPVVDRDRHVLGIVGISDLIRHNAADPWDICRGLGRITAPKEVGAKAA
ncbi:MAG TPA: CBS domain-containing protein [Terriglobales bacterium]|nr:CBS domain-containing protein [Terriglobales bacterium]